MDFLEFETEGTIICTRGLIARGLSEMRVRVGTAALLPEAKSFLKFVAEYMDSSGQRIKPGQTLNYGYWLVKFQAAADAVLEVWEYNPEATEFIIGASLTLSYWRDQHETCARFRGDFSPPRPDRLTAVSLGVMEGLPVQAVRYRWREHMSGWLLVTEEWDKKIESLTNHHTYHVTAGRPDLARYLALPIGFRFDLTNGERAWIDEEVFQGDAPGR